MTIYIGTTGHRPNKIGGYNNNNLAKLLRLEFRRILKIFKSLTNDQLVLNSGMALGWDTYAVAAAMMENIPFRAIIPFKGQEQIWPEPSQRIYQNALTYAQEVKVCSEIVTNDYMVIKQLLYDRDQVIVNESDLMVGCWNGTKGGTAHTIKLANAAKKPILIINPNDINLGIFKSDKEIEKWFKNAIK